MQLIRLSLDHSLTYIEKSMDTIIELTPHAVLVGDRMHMLPSLIGVDSQRDAHSVLVITGADPS